MRHLERNKPVKSTTPATTIARVRHIIKGLGCSDEIQECTQPNGIFYSYNLRLYRQNDTYPLFACNGKGVTPALAQASAYGELMERLQNLAFYMATVYYSEIEDPICEFNSLDDFQYTRDEQVFETKELVNRELPLLQSLFAINNASRTELIEYLSNSLKWPRMRCVPFTNIMTGRKHFLPFRFMQWIVGSNGMCAGNTREEALIQGISEVFERVVLKKIYIKPFTPPDVPVELFSGHMIYEKIKQLEQYENVRIVIKDCSLDMELPVLGILVFSDDGQEFAFHLGADPSPITALERCFTEMYQGGQPAFHSIPKSGTNSNITNPTFWRRQLHHSIRSYSGQWPPQLLSNIPDYEFKGFPYHVSNSDGEDLDRLLQLIHKLNHQLLVRDSGILDFPAYYVYIPGMSEMTNVFDNLFLEQLVSFEKKLPLFFKMQSISIIEQQELAQHIAVFKEATLSGEFDAGIYFKHYPNAPIAQMKGKEIRSALEKGTLPSLQPTCFDCSSCSVADCTFESMNMLWKTIKKYKSIPDNSYNV